MLNSDSNWLIIASIICAVAAFVFRLIGVEFPVTEFLAIMFALYACYLKIKRIGD